MCAFCKFFKKSASTNADSNIRILAFSGSQGHKKHRDKAKVPCPCGFNLLFRIHVLPIRSDVVNARPQRKDKHQHRGYNGKREILL